MPIDHIYAALAAQLGIAEATPEVQAAVIDEVGSAALQRLSMLMYAQLGDVDREAFDALNESKDTAAMQTFIKEKFPNIEQLTQQAVTTEVQAFSEFVKSLPAE